jgi:aromatic ring hydroxylase
MAAVSAETTQSDVQALGPMTDRRYIYIASLKDNREVRIDGKQVSEVSTHPAFRGTIAELARVYATSRAVSA